MFLGFANFYRRFIQRFSQIAAPLISMLKTLSTKSAELKKSRDKVGGDSRAGYGRSKIDESGMENVEVDSGKVEIEVDEFGKKV